ncbi:unnamed protein product [Spodoptera exigua]|nr:unnamed protein product [Spodoptera exigua]
MFCYKLLRKIYILLQNKYSCIRDKYVSYNLIWLIYCFLILPLNTR